MSNPTNTGFLRLTVELEDTSYQQDLEQDLVIDSSDINESFINQPAKFAWYAVLAAKARSKADRLKAAADKQDDFIRKTLTGQLDTKVRQQMEIDGEKITESKVTSAIVQHPEYIQAVDTYNNLQEAFINANEDARILEAAREAMNQRKDMLISLGAMLRMDMSNVELNLKKQQVADVLRNGRTPIQGDKD